MEDSSNCDTVCDGESLGVILDQMTTVSKCDLQPLNIGSFSCSDCDDVSSVVSMKEGCGSPMSSWDSEPETDISSAISCHVLPDESLPDVDLEGNYPDSEEENQFVGVENNDDGFSWEMDNRNYEELLKKFIEKEEELRVSNFKLQLSEQEITGLKVQVEDSESQINDMHEKLELKEDELYEQKELWDKEIFKLRTQIENSESQLDNVHEKLNVNKVQLLMMHKKLNQKDVELDNVCGELNQKDVELDDVRRELELKTGQYDDICEVLKLKAEELKEQKELSEKEIFKLKTQIKESENQLENVREELSLKKEELQKQTAELDTHIPECVNKITNLMEQLKEAQKKLKTSKKEIATERNSKTSMTHELQCQIEEQKQYIASLECNIDVLATEKKDADINHKEELKKLNLKLLEMQLSNQKKQLSSKLEEYESRKKELEKKVMLHEGEKSNQKKLHSAQVKLLQDEISCLKKEFGQRMNEVEAANKESSKVMEEINEANVDRLKAEIRSRGDQISHMKKHIDELNTSLKELVVHYRTKVNDENKLILRVEELEKEVSNKNSGILEKGEEKKEAIKQLWSSLEANWSGCSDLFKR